MKKIMTDIKQQKNKLTEALSIAAQRIVLLKKVCKECPADSKFQNDLAEEEAHFRNIVILLAVLPSDKNS